MFTIIFSNLMHFVFSNSKPFLDVYVFKSVVLISCMVWIADAWSVLHFSSLFQFCFFVVIWGFFLHVYLIMLNYNFFPRHFVCS